MTILFASRSATGATSRTSATTRRWGALAREVAADRADRLVFAVTALLVGVGYSLLLPFAYTQRFSFANWHYLDARYLIFSVAFALGLGWLVTLQVHAVRQIARNTTSGELSAGRTGPLGALAAVISVFPSLLCCSPVLPSLIGVIGLSAITRLTTTVQLQHFFATKENLLLGGALGLLLLSGLWSMRKLSRVACLTEECCTPATINPPRGRQARGELAAFNQSPGAVRSEP